MNHLPDNIYTEAWQVLYNCFGERMQDEELELMDSILSRIKLDREEHERWLSEQEDKDVMKS